MAKHGLHFGDKNTADIRLYLIGSSGQETEDPLFVHSQVLKKAGFFETKLSECSSSDKRPFEIKVTNSHNRENYIRCIQLLYSFQEDQRFYFSSVDDALAILPVASQIMFHDCIQSCMLYLDAVRWSPEQKAKLRALLTSLKLDILPELGNRLGILGKSDSDHIEMLKDSLQELLCRTLNVKDGFRNTAEKHMSEYFKAEASPAVKDACRSALLKEFSGDVERIKSEDKNIELYWNRLSWLVGVIQSCDGKLFETVLKLFCEDTNLRNSINEKALHGFAYFILNILCNRFLKAMGNGDIITPSSFRVFFLTNWVETMVHVSTWSRFETCYDTGIIEVAETLPLVEQKRIYDIWKDALIKHSRSTSIAFNWWVEKIHEAVIIDL
uniref:BTB domain-containing protein n=1 Tax=Picea sitchensis TaxID=3332 RepID=A9P2L7_PICSI|nr:unknown [Picea sitchensis]